MKKSFLAFSGPLLFLWALPLLPAEQPETEGNSVVGKEKAGSCAGCHGENGNSVVATFPKLANQHAAYLKNQLQAFKEGVRNDPVMAPSAMALSDQDQRDIAAYYSTQAISVNPALETAEDTDDSATEDEKSKETLPTLLLKGSHIYRNGNLTSAVSACIACHGPQGEGNKPAAFPALRAQHADYLMKTLKDFKSGSRNKNPDNMMAMIAKKMSDEEIKAVSYYLATSQKELK